MIDPSAVIWQTSSFCNGASSCAEVAWVTSSRCNNGSCIQVACCEGEVWVRDSKLGDASPVLRFTVGQWWSYIAAVKSHREHAYSGPVVLRGGGDEWRVWHVSHPGVVLSFDRAEVETFLGGVRAGDFDPKALKAPSSDSAAVASSGHASSASQKVPLAFVEPSQVSR